MMRRNLQSILAAALVLAGAFAWGDAPAVVEPADKTAADRFMRWVPGEGDSGVLQTGISRYVNPDGVSVDLIAAVHVADARYYQELNQRFTVYDSLLYEMVKGEGDDVPRPGDPPSGSAISTLQRTMTRMLDLSYQLDVVDYTAGNFVHADMDVDTFVRRQSERGESLFTLMLRSMMSEMGREKSAMNQPDVLMGRLLMALTSPDRPRQLKAVLATQFGDIEAQIAGLEGPDGSVILSERNDAAMAVLWKQIAGEKKKLGIFYGAAHLPGMEDKLLEKGFKKTGDVWLDAWRVPPATPTKPAEGPLANDASDVPAKPVNGDPSGAPAGR